MLVGLDRVAMAGGKAKSPYILMKYTSGNYGAFFHVDYDVTENTRIETVCKLGSPGVTYQCFIGIQRVVDSTTYAWSLRCNSQAGATSLVIGSFNINETASNISATVSSDEWFNLIFGPKITQIGESVSTCASPQLTNLTFVTFGGRWSEDSSFAYRNSAWQEIRFYEGDTLTRDYIPMNGASGAFFRDSLGNDLVDHYNESSNSGCSFEYGEISV